MTKLDWNLFFIGLGGLLVLIGGGYAAFQLVWDVNDRIWLDFSKREAVVLAILITGALILVAFLAYKNGYHDGTCDVNPYRKNC